MLPLREYVLHRRFFCSVSRQIPGRQFFFLAPALLIYIVHSSPTGEFILQLPSLRQKLAVRDGSRDWAPIQVKFSIAYLRKHFPVAAFIIDLTRY